MTIARQGAMNYLVSHISFKPFFSAIAKKPGSNIVRLYCKILQNVMKTSLFVSWSIDE